MPIRPACLNQGHRQANQTCHLLVGSLTLIGCESIAHCQQWIVSCGQTVRQQPYKSPGFPAGRDRDSRLPQQKNSVAQDVRL